MPASPRRGSLLPTHARNPRCLQCAHTAGNTTAAQRGAPVTQRTQYSTHITSAVPAFSSIVIESVGSAILLTWLARVLSQSSARAMIGASLQSKPAAWSASEASALPQGVSRAHVLRPYNCACHRDVCGLPSQSPSPSQACDVAWLRLPALQRRAACAACLASGFSGICVYAGFGAMP